MLRLSVRGPDTLLSAPLCAACPHSPAGCCVAPPRMDWSDIGRVVGHGGLSWLMEQLASKSLVPCARGLALRRVKGQACAGGPRLSKCVFHSKATGCTIAHDRRPATCNYYVCESVLAAEVEAGRDAEPARRLQAELVDAFVAWDLELDRRIVHAYGGAPPYDEAFLVWLGEAYRELCAKPQP